MYVCSQKIISWVDDDEWWCISMSYSHTHARSAEIIVHVSFWGPKIWLFSGLFWHEDTKTDGHFTQSLASATNTTLSVTSIKIWLSSCKSNQVLRPPCTIARDGSSQIQRTNKTNKGRRPSHLRHPASFKNQNNKKRQRKEFSRKPCEKQPFKTMTSQVS